MYRRLATAPLVSPGHQQRHRPLGRGQTLPAADVFPHNTLGEVEPWAAGIAGPAYALDDQTAIKVTDGTVEVVSEGQWKRLS